jgi:tetratricopeptide (TPR) repeat protein
MEESRAMTCEDVVREETVEKYLLGQLSDESRDSFEQHYFECRRCFGLLRTYGDLHAELEGSREAILPAATRRSWVWRWAWAPGMAVMVIAVTVGWWQRPLTESARPPDPGGPSAPGRPPSSPGSPSLPPSSPARQSLGDLARVEPPPYAPGRVRGAPDEATARFQGAMTLYQRQDYSAAIAGLQAATRLDPEAPHILFFLGASQLLAGRTDAASDSLRKTIALGDSAYLEAAHFYLAKALLQKGMVDEAIKELESAIRLRGDREPESRLLLGQLQAFKPPTK